MDSLAAIPVFFMPASSLTHHIQQAPFLRLLPPFITGILLQWYTGLHVQWLSVLFFFFLLLQAAWLFLPMASRFRLHAVSSVLLWSTVTVAGGLLVWVHDQGFRPDHILNHTPPNETWIVRIEEQPVEKPLSRKAVASVMGQVSSGTINRRRGKLLLYFQRDSMSAQLAYGDELLIRPALRRIKNSGNPGAFNYVRHCAFQDIYHQAYIKSGEYIVLRCRNGGKLDGFLISLRMQIVDILYRFIPAKKEASLAAALLIGFKDDLDKELLQSYADAGVVHIIAISGLHLGLIYWLLMRICAPFAQRPGWRWLAAAATIVALWLFSLLSGASPSVLRSAVMFTCIIAGNCFQERSSTYNTLAASAFLLLCYHPFWLWDAGFQLSYFAVLSLVIFMKPVYHMFYFRNKLMDILWKSFAVTIAAQVLTIPLLIYHFHQLPVYVLFTNLVAVPLSSFILCCELFLCCTAWFTALSFYTGSFIQWLIACMNKLILVADHLPFHTVAQMSISIVQVILLFLFFAATSYWLMEKERRSLYLALTLLLGCLVLRAFNFYHAGKQQRLVVYNIPGHSAIDLIKGRHCEFRGDSAVWQQEATRRFYMERSHTSYRISRTHIATAASGPPSVVTFGKHVIIIADSSLQQPAAPLATAVYMVILTRHSNLSLQQLQYYFGCGMAVADASCSSWQLSAWRAEARRLHIPFHSVREEGALVVNFLP